MFNSADIQMTADVEAADAIAKSRSDFKATREAIVAALTVEFQGMVFDADEESQNRMVRPISALPNDTENTDVGFS